jgi:amino acid adenylation domain
MNTIAIISALKSHNVLLRLDGDQLKLSGETGSLPPELLEMVKSRKEALISLLRNATAPVTENVIRPLGRQEDYPATDAQQSIWVLHQLDKTGGAYNIITSLHLKGEVSADILKRAFQCSLMRHESLRTVFREADGKLRQVITDNTDFTVAFRDISAEGTIHDHVTAEVKRLTYRRFDLEKGPLLEVQLLKLAAQEYALILAIHHIISDGWSVRLLLQEMMHFYSLLRKGAQPAIALPEIQYKDYAAWLLQQLSGEAGKHAQAFWKERLSTIPDPLDLPADLPRPGTRSFEGAIARFYTDASLYPAIVQYCRQHSTTPFNFFLSTLSILLYKLSGQDTIVIGTPAAGRTHGALHQQIGLFVNTLPLTARVQAADSFAAMLQRIAGDTIAAFEHQHYPFARIAEQLAVKWDSARNPLFDVMLVLQDTAIGDGRVGFDQQAGFAIDRLDTYLYGSAAVVHSSAPSKFDLSFDLGNDPNNRFYMEIAYSTRLFTKESIISLYKAYQHIIAQVLANPGIPVQSIELADQEAQRRLLESFNDTAVPYAPGKTVIDLFEEQVQRTPERPALRYGSRLYTYREVDQLSNQLAAYLVTTYGITAGELVGIQLERSERMPLSILAVLKAGAAYVPIGTDYPAERVAYIVKDAALKVLINEDELSKFFSAQHRYSTERLSVKPTQNGLAYCIYTSGSTGTPKGVLNSHAGLYNRLRWMGDYLHVDGNDVFLQKTPYTFDVSVWELLLPFITGSVLVMADPGQHKDPAYLQEVIARHGVTIAHFVPSMLGAFLPDVNAAKCASLQHIICSGEELPAQMVVDVRRKLVNTRIHNLYGPTEAAIDVTAIDLTDADVLQHGVSIGYPIANTRIYIVNDSLQLQPPGIPGELLISGVQVANGYLHLEELTAARFIPDPFSPGNRVYRTGDIAKWLPDGAIQYLGRKDNQVKIRGNRIELGEVENALCAFPGIRSGVAAVRELQGEKALVAYFTGSTPLDVPALKVYLKTRLPDYMIPGYYMQLDELPLTSSGKADKKRLPLPELRRSAYEAPRSQAEQQLAAIWQQILGKVQIGRKDNFFELGGHSLKATRLASQLNRQLGVSIPLTDLFDHPVLEDQARLLSATQSDAFAAIPAVEEQLSYALSSSQQRLWILSQLEESSVAYNMPAVFELEGILNLDALSAAFDTLIERHESLRTAFREAPDGTIRQYILPAASGSFQISYHDLSRENERTIKERIQGSLFQPFDLGSGYLLRAALYQLAAGRWLFTYVMHHIISDGWSMEVLIRELLQLYHAYTQGLPNPLPPLRIQYKDYAAWQQGQLGTAASASHKAWWLQQLEGSLPVLELPADKARPAIKTYHGARLIRRIAPSAAKAFSALCRSADSTLFTGLLALVKALLYRYTGQEDMIIGSPVAGREHSDLEDQIGFYVNTLPLRTRFSGRDSYLQLLSHVRQTTLDAYRHQAYPFDALVEALDLQRDLSRNALFDVLVALQHGTTASLVQEGFAGLEVREYDGLRQDSKFDLQFSFIESGSQLQLHIIYNTDLYYSSTISRLARHLEQLLAAVTADPARPISALTYLDKAEQQTILNFNHHHSAPPPATLVAAFKQTVAQHPDATALVFEQTQISYHELDQASDQLAGYLLAGCQLRAGDLVAIQLERSEWMIIALWGVLKSGAAFVPVDPAYPKERIDYMIADSGCRLVFDQEALMRFRAQRDNIHPTPAERNTPEDCCYVIYTSGSTGRPKGVMIPHAALYHYISTIGKAYGISANERILQLSNFAFDAAVEQIMLSMLHGACLYVPRQELITDTAALSAYIAGHGITHLHTVPTLLQHIDYSQATSLKRVVSAGEPCPPSLLQKVGAQIDFYNKYGPTEATISATLYKAAGRDLHSGTIPIGRPLNNSRVYILNEQGALQPVGVPGEICIGGHSLADGYLHQPALTAEKFVADPYHPGQRIYRTGDVGKWQEDGNILFLGRKDDQVKIRGHRIELGEISQTLQEYPGVSSAVSTVVKDNSGESMLVAYVVSASTLHTDDLRSWLRARLPQYMQPAHIIQLEALPLLPNGKLDKRALPAPQTAAREYIAPRNSLEAQLVHIWQEILAKDQVGVKDNFFELGGHSLKATRLASRLSKTFDVKIALKDLFSHTTPEEQARLIAASQQEMYAAIPAVRQQASYALSSSQRRLWVLSQFEEGSVAYNMPGIFELEGPLDRTALAKSFDTLIERHESLRTVFRETPDGEIRQYILPVSATGFEVRYHPDARTVQTNLYQPFNLGQGPLLRADLYQTGTDQWLLAYAMHHIISDGWSMEVLIKELLQLYHAYAQGQSVLLAPLRIHYKDYAAWQQEQLLSVDFRQHRQYWLEQFSGEVPVLELPADKPRPAVKTYHGDTIYKQLDTAVINGLQQLCESSGSTLFMGLLAAVKVLLYRYTGQEDIIVGSPVAGRDHSDLEEQIGFYVNTLALRTQFSGTDTYEQLLSRVKQVSLHAYEHQSYPFDALVDELQLQRDLSHSALFDVMLVLQHASSAALVEEGFSGLKVRAHKGLQQGSKFDLQFTFVVSGEQLQLYINYNTDIFHNSTITRLSHHLEQLLAAIIAAPQQPIATLSYLDAAAQTLLLDTFNATAVPYDASGTVVDLLEAQVLRSPDHTALLFEGRSFSYQQLNGLSNQLAHYLSATYQVGKEDRVAIRLDRNEWLVISLLGVLKSGAAYVPIDPAYPQDRIDYILEDSSCKVLLDERALHKFLLQAEKYSQSNPGLPIMPEDLAYVIYTSGSTGRPKGVMITHGNVSAFMDWCKREFGASSYEIVLGVTSICFDLSVFEICYTLVSGKQLRLLTDALSIPQYLDSPAPLLLNTVPSVVNSLLATGANLSRVHVLNMAGEPVAQATLRQLDCERMEVRNLYGPSEDTTYSTCYRLKNDDNILIGRPISNTQVYILNDHHQLQPLGIAGEICISGSGLARGYLNQTELTAAKFVPHPFIAGERLYKTGDLGKWLPDGNLVFLGRKDDQVKIRGYRVEPGEISQLLQDYPGISSATVVAIKDSSGDYVLAAYFAGEANLHAADLRSWLAAKLPHYMQPAHFIRLEALPLLPNGKLNKKALPAPEAAGREYIAPRNELEARLVQIWQDILGKAEIGVKDHFFERGGHSLKATRLASQLSRVFHVKIALKDLFNHPVLEDQAKLVAVSQQSVFTAIPALGEQESYVLSSAQRRLWVLSQFEEGSVAYNMPGLFEFEGTLDAAALSRSFETLIQRHEILRTVFRETTDGEIRQYILPATETGFKINYHDQGQELQINLSQPFNLGTGPLLRADLYPTGPGKWLFTYVMHHIISDGWSMEVLIRELLQLYQAYVQGQPDPLPPLRIHYKDYAAWQQEQLQSDNARQHKEYWLQQFSDGLPVLELPAEKPRPAVKTYHGASMHKQLEAGIADGLNALCQSSGSTLFMTLLAAVKVLLYRYTGQEDIIIGSPVAGRGHSDLEDQIGFYVNTLALRTQFSGTDTYLQLLARIKQVTLDAYEHQSYPFDALVDELHLQRDTSRSALFDVMLVLQHGSGASLLDKALNGLQVKALESTREQSKFDLQFNFIATAEGLSVRLHYNTDIYHKEIATQLLNHLSQLLSAIIADPVRPIATIPCLSAAEQQTILQFNKALAPATDTTIIAAFEQTAAQTPDHIALVFEQTRLTYRELDKASNQLARYLQQTYRLTADDLVAIQLERSEWMIISLLAVLKAGAAFVPIDPGYPVERINYIVTDSRCRLILDDRELQKYRPKAFADEALEPVATTTDLAYVIYTSGSTGHPKGVMISHGALYNYIAAIGSEYGIDNRERILQISNFAFDAAVEQIMLSILHGACLYIPNRQLATDTAGLTDYIADNGITHLHTVPALLQHIDFAKAGSLKRVVSAGEECPPSLQQRVSESTAFYNKYGPTEATISATLYKAESGQADQQKVPIGQPLRNSRVYILNDHDQLQPTGVAGEICIAGNSLARGYLHQPALTAARFVPDPFQPGQLMYRTGDIGKWRADGNMVFLGRKDDQVKIRGHRIEPGEIAHALQAHQDISGAVVIAVKDSSGDNMLVAYLVSALTLDSAHLRSWLASRLPHYMLPAHYIQLEALPLLPNGKLNRKALPLPGADAQTASTAYVAPRNPVEVQLVQIWQQILGREQIGVRDNFFELGGHSLKATHLISQVQKEFGVSVKIKDVFMNPTIETVGELIRAGIWLERPKNNSKEDRILVEI